MSATHKAADGYVTIMAEHPGDVIRALEYECGLFDMSVDFDIKEIEQRLKAIKETKRVALIKLSTFPIEFCLAFLLLPKHYYVSKRKEIVLWIKFLFKKIDYDTFLQERNKLLTREIK